MSFDNRPLDSATKQYEESMGVYWSDIDAHVRAAHRLRAQTVSHGLGVALRAIARPLAAGLHRVANLVESGTGIGRPAH